ncbi:MAG: acyclic terpene utilization AtuA family protein, partial [Melioribacteraceae bacterium]|nr:acyclic terpene utilization AtuA family protein [Melioribacteraceae bacterium]
MTEIVQKSSSKMKEKVRIASGQGFWGDLIDAPYDQVSKGDIDYLVMDYLAEVTMSILQKQMNKNPEFGYARDIPSVMERILPIIKEKNIKVITNGGGVNPAACGEAIKKVAEKIKIKNLKIAVITGDNIIERIDDLISKGEELNNMETGESITQVKDKLLSANVYLGSSPIVDALIQGADIVITGRTTDTGLTLAPMIYEFNWQMDDYDLMAAGTVAGHILECGGQASGGNFLGDWKSIELTNIGFPIAEAYPSGELIITKHQKLGGRVSYGTVAEQLVYEIGDPQKYITPDCIADFTSIQLEDLGNDRVKVFGIKGRPETATYKVSCSYSSGFSASATLTYSWPEALTKARAADSILRERLLKLGLNFEEIRTEFLGYDSCHGPLSTKIDEENINEIVFKIAVRSQDFHSVDRFGKEIAPLILTGPPSVTGFAGGRPKPSEVVAYWPALINKEYI